MAQKVSFLLLALFLSGFLGPAGAQEKRLDAFTVSFSSMVPFRFPLWMAKEAKIYEKYGLQTHLVYIASTPLSLSAVVSGDVDVAGALGSSAIGMNVRGGSLVIFASLGSSPQLVIANPPIASIRDLKGKIFGGSRTGSSTDVLISRFFSKVGLVPGKDFKIFQTGLYRSSERILLMKQGRIDATMATPENIKMMELQGVKVNVLADLRDYGIYTGGGDLITTGGFIQSGRKKVSSFLMALSEGIWLGRNNRDLALRVFAKYLRIENTELLNHLYQSYVMGAFPKIPYPREEAIQEEINDLAQFQPDLEGQKARAHMDTTILAELEKEGFFARLYR